MSVRLQFDRIPPGVEVGPHRHGLETIVYLAAGQIVFEHGEDLERRSVVGAGDVLYEAPAEHHLVRNEGPLDALALLAAAEPDPRRPGAMLRRWDRDDEPVARHDAAPIVDDAGIRRRLLVRPGDFGSATFSVTEVEIDPGRADDWHRHPDSERLLVVFEGRGIVTVEDVSETLEPLVGIRIDPAAAHRVENTGRTMLRYFVCGTPGTDVTTDRAAAEAPRRRLDA